MDGQTRIFSCTIARSLFNAVEKWVIVSRKGWFRFTADDSDVGVCHFLCCQLLNHPIDLFSIRIIFINGQCKIYLILEMSLGKEINIISMSYWIFLPLLNKYLHHYNIYISTCYTNTKKIHYLVIFHKLRINSWTFSYPITLQS